MEKDRSIWGFLNWPLWVEQKFVAGYWENKVSRVKGYSVRAKNLYITFFLKIVN